MIQDIQNVSDNIQSQNSRLYKFIVEKSMYINNVIRNTIISINASKYLNIFRHNDVILTIDTLTKLYNENDCILNQIDESNTKTLDTMLESLQTITNKLSTILCNYGTMNINDLLFICFGSEFTNLQNSCPIKNDKIHIITKYVRPVGYKLIQWKEEQTNIQTTQLDTDNVDKTNENETPIQMMPIFECIDLDDNTNPFRMQVYGIQIIIQNDKLRKTLIIRGIVEDIHIKCIKSTFIKHKLNKLTEISNNYSDIELQIFMNIIDSLTLKDILIYSNFDIQRWIITTVAEANKYKKTLPNTLCAQFICNDLYSQYKILVNLFRYAKDTELSQICVLLYNSLITAHENKHDIIDSMTDSFPWNIKLRIKDEIKYNIEYSHNLSNKSIINKIPLDQQITIMKVNDEIKTKAIGKYKEIQGKPDELTMKTKQYLEGLVKIPFGIYREEAALLLLKNTNKLFIETIQNVSAHFPYNQYKIKTTYSSAEIENYIHTMNDVIYTKIISVLYATLKQMTINKLQIVSKDINQYNRKMNIQTICLPKCQKTQIIQTIASYLITNYCSHNRFIINLIYENNHPIKTIITDIQQMTNMINKSKTTLLDMESKLDASVYSHTVAKKQLIKVFGQWMSGEQSGYCLGFEGFPGIGKTSMAKYGITKCLTDDNGDPRPFAYIALGGSSNGSTLEGHGYTYMNSTWGKIVDILMESKCMNPIIYIDELDKVSQTEHGKEIIGILTHLIDTTQNDAFQDKYFSGINIDVSKVLFIFSYNDHTMIDKILLDRIHRIKFENLTIEDKKTIVNKHILPDINKKMGFENIVEMSEEVIEHIIMRYTTEPGVRKLKELIFDIFGEINIELIKNTQNYSIPRVLTIEDIDNMFLLKYNPIIERSVINTKPRVGMINGLWANTLGNGGVIPIQTSFYPSTVFLELQLTGLQGDVMKESMIVAKTLAWNLTDDITKKKWLSHFNDTKCQGLHIHCPDGSIPKDGPSAGAAITVAIYSLLNNLPINSNIAITGEITLDGNITAIGGLDVKIYGGIRSGINTFLYPKENERDFSKFKTKFKHNEYNKIEFIPILHISDVFSYIFENGVLDH